MHPTTHPTNAEDWIGKAEAATRLKVSERTALALAAAKKILTRKGRDPDTNQVAVQFNAVDLDRYAFERDNPGEDRHGGRPAAPVAPQALELVHVPVLPAANEAMSTIIDKPPAPPRPWLTLEEAAEFSGLAKGWLLEHAESPDDYEPGKEPNIAVRDMGKGKHTPGGRWRFHRDSLERA